MPAIHYIPTEIEEITKMLRGCGILPTALLLKYLERKGRKEHQAAVILNQIIKNKLGFYVDDKKYIAVSLGYTTKDINRGLVKALYLMVDLLDDIGEYYVHDTRDIPHVLSFSNKNLEISEDPFYDVFYVEMGREQKACYKIINNFTRPGNKYKIIIILDAETQIDLLELNSDRLEIAGMVTVNSAGDIQYLS